MAEPKDGKGVPAVKTPVGVVFSHNGVDIPFDGNRLVDLTAMWRAVGTPSNKEPKEWRRYAGSEFLKELAAREKVGVSRLFRVTRGRTGSSWGHWSAALAYAKYLSPAFHVRANEAIREWARELADPDLKADRAIKGYRREGRSDQWVLLRIKGKLRRRKFTDILKEHGVNDDGQGNNGYLACTEVINIKVLGGTAREIKAARNLPASAATRDHFTDLELIAVELAEAGAEHRIGQAGAKGNGECARQCARAAEIARQAPDAMKADD